jgi:hypothetical protein
MEYLPQGPRSNLPKPGNKWTVVCLVLFLIAGAEFVVRGPIRAVQSATGFNDFLAPYIQANAWARGLDPYSPATLLRLWPTGAAQFVFLPIEVEDGSLIAKRGIPTAYPITALVLIAPLSRLPWRVAYALWLTINLALFATMLYALMALAGFSYRSWEAILLVAATLALAPFHTGIVTANVALVVIELGVIAVWTARSRYDLLTATLLAISIGLKPQIGLCFFLYYLVRRRWNLVGITFVLLIVVTGLGLLRMQLSHTLWLSSYINDNRVLLQRGTLANFTSINPLRFGLTNLQVVLYPVAGTLGLANILAASLGIILLTLWAFGMHRMHHHDELELLGLSAIVVISLLPIYHRFYDAALLVLPLGWLFVSFRMSRILAVLSILLMLPFLIPGGTILQTLQNGGSISDTLANRWWWQMFVMPHEVWMLLLLAILLLYEMISGITDPSGGET